MKSKREIEKKISSRRRKSLACEKVTAGIFVRNLIVASNHSATCVNAELLIYAL